MKKALLTLLVFQALISPVQAEFPKNWYAEGLEDFLNGEAISTSIQADGSISLTSDLSELARLKEGSILSSYLSRQGQLYLGTANGAAVYQLDIRNGKPQVKSRFQWNEGVISALSEDQSGQLLAALSPNAKVFKSNPQGQLQHLASFSERYIWDMLSRPEGTYIATGDQGNLYQMDNNGNKTLLFKSEESNLKTLYYDAHWGLLIGSGSKGLVYRYRGKDKVDVLLDTSFSEITAITSDNRGNVYVAATVLQPAKNQPKSVVYLINQTGQSEALFQLQSETAYALALNKQGNLVIGTGSSGRIYTISGPLHPDQRQLGFPGKAQSQQIARIFPLDNNDLLMIGANPALVERFEGNFRADGVYLSEILEPGLPSQWGVLRFNGLLPAGTRIQAWSRSGNTARPDNTWSTWNGPYRDFKGQPITSPPGKYLQLKFELGTSNRNSTPFLHSYDISYLRNNIPPRILDAYFLQPGIYFTPHTMPKASGPRTLLINPQVLQKLRKPRSSEDIYTQYLLEKNTPSQMLQNEKQGMLTLTWEAQDQNEDALTYDIHYRSYGSSQWRILAKDILDPLYSFDSTSLADGLYHFRVYAKDEPSNIGNGYQVFRETDLITIDNTLPEIQNINVSSQGQKIQIRFKGLDKTSPLAFAEVAVNGKPFELVSAQDKIIDHREELFQFEMASPGSGEHILAIRIKDRMGNIATAQHRFQLP